MSGDDSWKQTWRDARERALVAGAEATVDQRLAWLEQALRLAHHTGALERLRADKRAERGIWARKSRAEPGVSE